MNIHTDFASRGDRVLSPVLGHFSRLNIVRGSGSYLYDASGRAYLDFTAGIAVASTGHCHPAVVDAITTQASSLIHACAGVVYYEANVALAETLGTLLGNDLDSVFFTQSGTEAVEASLKLAKFVSGKSDIVAFKGGFHGRTMGSLSVTSSKDSYRTGIGPMVPGVHFLDFPNRFRSPWPDADFDSAGKHHLDNFFSHCDHDHQIAAVIIEPVIGEGGYIPAPASFLSHLREWCDRLGILLIFDEIQSGFLRSGSWFAFQNLGVRPDIITLAKGIASGLPLGACVASDALMSQWATGSHGGTYGGNPVCCAAGLATIDVLRSIESELPEKASHLRHLLDKRLSDHPHIGDIRGSGLMIGIELVKDRTANLPYPELLATIMAECREQNLMVVSCGIHGNVLRLMPPLTISLDELDIGVGILADVLNAHR